MVGSSVAGLLSSVFTGFLLLQQLSFAAADGRGTAATAAAVTARQRPYSGPASSPTQRFFLGPVKGILDFMDDIFDDDDYRGHGRYPPYGGYHGGVIPPYAPSYAPYPPHGGYPPHVGYPPHGVYPPHGGYPPHGEYPPHGGYPPYGGHPPPGAYPPYGPVHPQPIYPPQIPYGPSFPHGAYPSHQAIVPGDYGPPVGYPNHNAIPVPPVYPAPAPAYGPQPYSHPPNFGYDQPKPIASYGPPVPVKPVVDAYGPPISAPPTYPQPVASYAPPVPPKPVAIYGPPAPPKPAATYGPPIHHKPISAYESPSHVKPIASYEHRPPPVSSYEPPPLKKRPDSTYFAPHDDGNSAIFEKISQIPSADFVSAEQHIPSKPHKSKKEKWVWS
ncbi:hypothetical protein HAZT_HAZT004129 [Hyalella azteca]|uniref:Extensin n=1 Tax=Hyalella azteca TaxID=294128 RepID=A0A6A0H5Q8_HYAAZ|nr:extensin [Hyalella azteca]KAA0200688.1 hypothetical protein HAZT_HAZT004129 [Hyalella azteca]